MTRDKRSTLDILTEREANGTIDANGRFVLFTLRRRAAIGFVQPTGEQIYANLYEQRQAELNAARANRKAQRS